MKTLLLVILVSSLTTEFTYAQVKATSSEINAGIDDDKFATALALQGSKYLDQTNLKISATTTVGANTYNATINPAITAYSFGQLFYIKITTSNTGSSTLNLNGLGAKTLVKNVNTLLANNDLLADKIYAVYYDGINFQVMNAADAISMANNKLLGRYSTGSGTPQDITLGPGLTISSAGTLYSGLESGSSATKVMTIMNPAGGQFKGGGVQTGAFKIQLPTNKSIMFAIKGTINTYDSTSPNNRSTTFLITCYGSSMGNGYSATFTGSNAPNYTVRWYTNGITPAIYIGELTDTWNYVTFTIDEVQASYTGITAASVSDGWSVSMATAFIGTLAATKANTLPFSNFTQPITNYAVGTNTALTGTDNVLAAFGKIQGQLNSRLNLNTTQSVGTVFAAPSSTSGTPLFRSLLKTDTKKIFGADGTLGVLDWNDVTNTQPGFGPTLLLGSADNGFGVSNYFYPFTIEYATKNGAGNLTQIAYPYKIAAMDGIQYRTRYSGVYSAWRKIFDSSNFTNLSQLTTRNFIDLQSKPTTLSGYGITDAATVTSVSALDANAVHKNGNETITGIKLFSTNVGIGTTNTQGYKLAVGGTIIAENIKIKPQTAWPDYVFEKDHPMRSLRDLERFILANKHLPDIPSAQEVKKVGLDIGEMNAKLLQKIEELTLYLIDLKKENETLKNRLDKLEKK